MTVAEIKEIVWTVAAAITVLYILWRLL